MVKVYGYSDDVVTIEGGSIIEHAGPAAHTLTECTDEDADVYSDVFEIESEMLTHEVVRKEAAQ